MSRGPGQIEQRIAELFAATRDRALSISDISDHAFALAGKPATRAQRLSATRAAHRLLRRVRDTDDRVDQLRDQARSAIGREPRRDIYDREYYDQLEALPDWLAADKLSTFVSRIGAWSRLLRVEGKSGWLRAERDYWCMTTLDNGRAYFHPPDVPVRVWAVSIQPAGVIWADAEVVKITERNVMVRCAGELARLDREKLWYWWAFWRGVRFVSSRTGRIAARLDETWQERYGHASGGVPPIMQMPLARAMELLGVPVNYTRDDVIAAFRRAAKKAHPDLGGTAEMFRLIVEARDRLLASIGTSAPAPRMPTYYPSGIKAVYRRARRSQQRRLGHTRRIARA